MEGGGSLHPNAAHGLWGMVRIRATYNEHAWKNFYMKFYVENLFLNVFLLKRVSSELFEKTVFRPFFQNGGLEG